MVNLLSNPTSEAGPLDDKADCGRRSPAAVYNGAQYVVGHGVGPKRPKTNDATHAERTDYSNEFVVSNTGYRTVSPI